MNGQSYPSTDGVKRTPRLARALFAPRADELSAISNYTYYSIAFERSMPELVELFDIIALTEMRHFRLLGELIDALGADPAINMHLRTTALGLTEDEDSRAPVAAVRVLRSLLHDEEVAAREYARLAGVFEDDPAAATILTCLAADEAAHARALRDALRR